jgi:hypothetical protein
MGGKLIGTNSVAPIAEFWGILEVQPPTRQNNSVRPPPILSRRQLLLLAGSAVRLGASRDDFWNTKPPSEWDAGEIYRLMNRSPWASTVDVKRLTPGETLMAKAVVTWESALPICDALKIAAVPEFADHYVIGVDGAATGGNSAEYLRYAALRASGQPKWTWATSVREVIRSSPVYQFSFLRSAAPIGPKTREVVFLLNLRPGYLAARFKPDQMLYHGQLTL